MFNEHSVEYHKSLQHSRPWAWLSHHVVEGLGTADEHHQALFRLSRHRSKLTANGTIWRKAVYRYVRNLPSARRDAKSCEGTLFRASQFLSEELPIRLAHRVQELGDLPDHLNEMPSIKKVQDWYAQSFEVC